MAALSAVVLTAGAPDFGRAAKAEAPAATLAEPVVEAKAEDAPPVIETVAEAPPLMIEAKPATKAKTKAKKKPKQLALNPNVDGRAIAGQRWKLANDDALVPVSAE